jgi:mRNA-degrading endonuclease RelE of RelBE toxin-antitoxin system
MFKLFLTSRASREFKKLPREISLEVSELFNGEFRKNPLSRMFNVKKLNVPFLGFRLRLGNYRILFTIEKEHIIVYSIKHRKDAYK